MKPSEYIKYEIKLAEKRAYARGYRAGRNYDLKKGYKNLLGDMDLSPVHCGNYGCYYEGQHQVGCLHYGRPYKYQND